MVTREMTTMRRRLPPLKTLPAFEIAAERLSFTAAAGELHLTHGAVSRQIQALEAQLGVSLFRRRNRRIELTEAGLAFLPSVHQALQLLETSTAEIATSPRESALVVSCVATFMMRWLIPRLYAFNSMYPKIEVRLSASHSLVEFARTGLDVAIRVGRPPWPRLLFFLMNSVRSVRRLSSLAAPDCGSAICGATGSFTLKPAPTLGPTGRGPKALP